MFIDKNNTNTNTKLAINAGHSMEHPIQDILYRKGKPNENTKNAIDLDRKNWVNNLFHRPTRMYERTYVEPNDIDVSINIVKNCNVKLIAGLEEIRLGKDVIRFVNGYKLSLYPIEVKGLNSVINGNPIGTMKIRNIKTGITYGIVNLIKENISNRVATDTKSITINEGNYRTTITDEVPHVKLFTNYIDKLPANINTTTIWNSEIKKGTYKTIKYKSVVEVVDGNKNGTEKFSSSTLTISNNLSNSLAVQPSTQQTVQGTGAEKFIYGKLYLSDTNVNIDNMVSDVIPFTQYTNVNPTSTANVVDLNTGSSTELFVNNSVLPNAIQANKVVILTTNDKLYNSDFHINMYPDLTTGYNNLQIVNNSSVPSGYTLNNNDTIGNIYDIYKHTTYTNGSTTAVAALPSNDELLTYVNVFPYIDSYGQFKVVVVSNTDSSYYKGNLNIRTYSTLTRVNAGKNDLIKNSNISYYVSNQTSNSADDTLYIHLDTSKTLIMNIGDTVRIPIIHSATNYSVETNRDIVNDVKDVNPVQGYKRYRENNNANTIYRHQDVVDGDLLLTGISEGNVSVKVITDPKSFASVYKTFNVQVLPNPTNATVELETSYTILTSDTSKRVAFYINKCKDVDIELIVNKDYLINHRLYKYYNHETQEMSGYIIIQPLPFNVGEYGTSTTTPYIPFQVKVKALSGEEVIGNNIFTGRVYPQGQHVIEVMDEKKENYLTSIVNNIDTNTSNSSITVNLYTTAKYIMTHEHSTTISGYTLEEVGGVTESGKDINTTITTTDIDKEFDTISNNGLKLLYPNSKIGYRNDYKLYGQYRDHLEKLYSNAVLFDLAKKEAQEHIFRYDAKFFRIVPNRVVGQGSVVIAGYEDYSKDVQSHGNHNYKGGDLVKINFPFNNVASTAIPNNEVWVNLQHVDPTQALDYADNNTKYTILKWKDRNSVDEIYNCKIYLPSVSGKLLTSLNNISKQTNKNYFTKSSTTIPTRTTNLKENDSWLDTSTGKVWVCRNDIENDNYWYAYPEQIVGNPIYHRYPRVGIGNIPLDILPNYKVTPLDGCYDVDSPNYGNYKDANNNIFVYIPAFYTDNNGNYSSYRKKGYNLHNIFINPKARENNYIGLLVNKYPIHKDYTAIDYSKENRECSNTIPTFMYEAVKTINESTGLGVDDIAGVKDMLNELRGSTTYDTNRYTNLISNINLHTDGGVVCYDRERLSICIKDDSVYRRVIVPNKKYVSVTVNGSANVDISTNGLNYTIVNNYSDIVSYSSRTNGISVTGIKKGKAILYLFSKYNNKDCINSINVEVV